jgi:hypothetical protein
MKPHHREGKKNYLVFKQILAFLQGVVTEQGMAVEELDRRLKHTTGVTGSWLAHRSTPGWVGLMRLLTEMRCNLVISLGDSVAFELRESINFPNWGDIVTRLRGRTKFEREDVARLTGIEFGAIRELERHTGETSLDRVATYAEAIGFPMLVEVIYEGQTKSSGQRHTIWVHSPRNSHSAVPAEFQKLASAKRTATARHTQSLVTLNSQNATVMRLSAEGTEALLTAFDLRTADLGSVVNDKTAQEAIEEAERSLERACVSTVPLPIRQICAGLLTQAKSLTQENARDRYRLAMMAIRLLAR